jgi:hypothetical protein
MGIASDGGEDEKTESEVQARRMLAIYIKPAVLSDSKVVIL